MMDGWALKNDTICTNTIIYEELSISQSLAVSTQRAAALAFYSQLELPGLREDVETAHPLPR